jgi:hypothetical protein
MVKPWPIMILPVILLVAIAQSRSESKGQYRGHRVFVWAIDKASHNVRGFDDAVITPGQRIAATPIKGYEVRFDAGPIETVTVTDFRTETEERHVRFRISHGTGSSEGTKNLTSPFLAIEYGTKEDLASVIFAVPVATISAKPLLNLLARKYEGTAAELEDLLLAAAAEPNYGDFVRLSDILEAYRLLGRSQRSDDWLRRLEVGSPRERVMAAAVLMNLGDGRGTSAFCKACIQATGNEQVGLTEILSSMPPSDEALATIVELIVSPTALLTQVPGGVGVSDIDRRFLLIRALTGRYPRDRLGKHEDRLRTWAGSKAGQARGGRQILEYLDVR